MATDERFEGLAAFLAVARARSFRAAARELQVTPGAVSQAIAALERRLGLPLFTRTTRSVGLTEAGLALRERASPAVEALHGAFLQKACWAYEGEEFPVVQLVWPDKQGRWPWEDGVRAGFRDAQPVLAMRPPLA